MHGTAGLDAGDGVSGDAVFLAVDELVPVWVAAGEIEEVDSCEYYEKARNEGEGVYCVGGVEAAVEDERGAEGRGCEGNVVQWVYAVR